MATDVIARGMASSASAEGGEDTVARAEIAAIKDGTSLDSFADVESALAVKADITDIPTVPITVIQKNGIGITPVSGTVNITVPTTASEVSALPDSTKYAASLSLEINASTFVVTAQLKDQNGDSLGSPQTIDLPLESVVVGGSYDDTTKKVVLTLQNGNTVEFSVADLVSGLQTELSASNKLNPAYIDYDSTHAAVSDTEKSTWNGKQSALTTEQLAAVNSGITEDGVEQIETNKNNILTLQESVLSYADVTFPLDLLDWSQDVQGIYYSTPINLPLTKIYAASITSLLNIPSNSGLIVRIDGDRGIGLYANTGTWVTGQQVKVRAIGTAAT